MSSRIKNHLSVALCLLAILSIDICVHSEVVGNMLARLHIHALHPLENLFWDAEPYSSGITTFNQGRSPYSLDDLDNPLPFAYPPAFLWVGGALARLLPTPWGWRLYVLAYMGSIFTLELLLAAVLLGRMRRAEIITLLILTPLCVFMSTVFWSGNIHLVWYGAAILAAIPGAFRGRWAWFYLVSVLAMINQPIFFLLLLFPIFAGKKQYLPSALTAIVAGASYLAQKIFSPVLYQQFQATVSSHLLASRDFGEGVFGASAQLFARFHILGTGVPGAIQIVFSAAILGTLFWLRPRVLRTDRRWWALIALAIVLMNPRIMPYDSALGLIPAIYFLIYGMRPPKQWLVAAAVMVASVLGHKVFGFSLLLLSGFVVGAWQLSDQSRTFYGTIYTESEQPMS
jgi:hypothetical protein